jgi:hypothetical protein
MNSGTGTAARRALPAAGRFILISALLLLPAVPRPAHAADYPRRVAIAPFSLLTPQDEIRQTVSILPRLLSSRLMAIAGAEVLLLPPGETPPAEAARDAGFPLLLRGTVAKLGAGYSIDLAATDLATGQSAGAFFAAAATEDEIIPRLGDLASDVSATLFGVKTAARAQPAPPPSRPAPALPAPPEAQAPPVPEAAAVAAAPEAPFVPSALKRVSQSDKIADELYGVVAGEVDAEGNAEVIAYGANVLYFYRVKGTEILPFTRITKPRQHHFLNVEAADIDGDGAPELLVTDLVGDDLQSFVLKKAGDVYRPIAEKIPYFLVVLPDWEGRRVVVGQRAGFDTPFQGRLVTMRWDGMALVPGEALPANNSILPLAKGILGLSSARFSDGWKLVYTDESSHLRIVGPSGKSEYKSRDKYGLSYDSFEWGPFRPLEGSRAQYYLRKAARSFPGRDGEPWLLIPGASSGILSKALRSYDDSRVVLLQWDGGQFVERAATPKGDHFFSGADRLFPGTGQKGGKVIASVIEQGGSAFKDMISRLELFALE